jgi:hypothetical protein
VLLFYFEDIMTIQQFSINTISNPADRTKLLNVIRECSNALTKIEMERSYIKDAIGVICKELQLPKRLVNKLVRVYYKQNFDEEVAVSDQFQQLYESVIK